MKLEMFRLYRN